MATQEDNHAQAAAEVRAQTDAANSAGNKSTPAAPASSPLMAIDAATLAAALRDQNKREPVQRIEGMDEGGKDYHFVNALGQKIDVEGQPIK